MSGNVPQAEEGASREVLGAFLAGAPNRLESPHFVLRKTEPACLGLSFKEVANPFPAFGRFKASHHPGLITGRCRQ
ncbi:hypothetical protein [Streptomyces agglomeratus]|uniref:hypothetical protein n=1 Tax=Streptomyces agglomeratus TaxID=285458 RepID=UPI001428A6A9|nr:hypothetical protein [Streptomyces agglomeratus]